MIWRIARKEYTEIVRDGRFVWTALIVVLLLMVSLGVGSQRYAEERTLRDAATAETRSQWLDQGEKGPHTAAHYGVYAFKPATPLALFDPGYNDYTGTLQYLEAHKENQASFKPAADATALQRFGDLSGAMVLQMLVPLLVVLLCFGMVSGEREEGTLRQLFSIGLSRSTLVMGKAAGAALALGTVLLPAAIGGFALALWLTAGERDVHDMAGFPLKLAVLLAGYAVFFAIFVCLSLAVSILSKSSGAALTTLVGFWIVAGLLVPRLAADVSKRVYPTPSSFALAAQIDEGRSRGPHAHEPNHPNHIAFRDEMLRKYKVARIEDLPYNFVGLALQRDEEIGFEVFDRAFGGVRRTHEKQDALQQGFALLSPFVAIKTLSSALAGTDVAFANDFSQAAEAYRRAMIRVLNDDLMKKAAGMSSYTAEWGYKAGPDLWNKVPAFDFDPPPLSTLLGRNLPSIAILLAWLAGAAWLVRAAARKAMVDA